MSKIILMLTVSAFAATAYGNTIIINPIAGKEQKIALAEKDSVKVPYTMYNEGKGSFSDNIDNSKINLSKHFVIFVKGEVAGTGARLNVNSLILKDHVLTLTYKLRISGKAISPDTPNLFFFAVIIDKKYQGEIKMVEL